MHIRKTRNWQKHEKVRNFDGFDENDIFEKKWKKWKKRQNIRRVFLQFFELFEKSSDLTKKLKFLKSGKNVQKWPFLALSAKSIALWAWELHFLTKTIALWAWENGQKWPQKVLKKWSDFGPILGFFGKMAILRKSEKNEKKVHISEVFS